jgi:8-oxo-dGTP pyrophosphatase MutT (NUDIX family)
LEGAIRETKEETGLNVTISKQLGIYTSVDQNITYEHHIFIADSFSGVLLQSNKEEILALEWYCIDVILTTNEELLLNPIKLHTIIRDVIDWNGKRILHSF